jgi:hypothetical protein
VEDLSSALICPNYFSPTAKYPSASMSERINLNQYALYENNIQGTKKILDKSPPLAQIKQHTMQIAYLRYYLVTS